MELGMKSRTIRSGVTDEDLLVILRPLDIRVVTNGVPMLPRCC